jgi:hypothetical protein
MCLSVTCWVGRSLTDGFLPMPAKRPSCGEGSGGIHARRARPSPTVNQSPNPGPGANRGSLATYDHAARRSYADSLPIFRSATTAMSVALGATASAMAMIIKRLAPRPLQSSRQNCTRIAWQFPRSVMHHCGCRSGGSLPSSRCRYPRECLHWLSDSQEVHRLAFNHPVPNRGAVMTVG